jgi:hypothetical protein
MASHGPPGTVEAGRAEQSGNAIAGVVGHTFGLHRAGSGIHGPHALLRNEPSVEGAYTPANTRGIPPCRITSRSSMLSAPAAMPATIEVSLPAGFTPVEGDRRIGDRHQFAHQVGQPGLFHLNRHG